MYCQFQLHFHFQLYIFKTLRLGQVTYIISTESPCVNYRIMKMIYHGKDTLPYSLFTSHGNLAFG